MSRYDRAVARTVLGSDACARRKDHKVERVVPYVERRWSTQEHTTQGGRPKAAAVAASARVRRRHRRLSDAHAPLLQDNAKAKFDETVDVALNLGVDPKRSDQVLRGMAVLPHGVGKTARVAVFAKGKVRAAAACRRLPPPATAAPHPD